MKSSQLYDVYNGNEFLMRAPLIVIERACNLRVEAARRIVSETLFEGSQCALCFDGRHNHPFGDLNVVIVQRAP